MDKKCNHDIQNVQQWISITLRFLIILILPGEGAVNEADLGAFYAQFVGVKPSKVGQVTSAGFAQMTANGDYKLNRQVPQDIPQEWGVQKDKSRLTLELFWALIFCREHYFFCFANFLLGRDIYGPGKYIFGVFDNRELEQSYKVQYVEYEDWNDS